MYIYDIGMSKLNKFLLPSMEETLQQCFNNGLHKTCQYLYGTDYYIDSSTKAYQLLVLFTDLKEDDIDSYKTFYLLLHNTKHMCDIDVSTTLDKASTFIENLIDFLDNNGYSIPNVYMFMLDKYYTDFYIQKFSFYQDIKNLNINNRNIISYAISNPNTFTAEHLNETSFNKIYGSYTIFPKISYVKTANSYRTYREAEEQYSSLVKTYVTANPIDVKTMTNYIFNAVDSVSGVKLINGSTALKNYIIDLVKYVTLDSSKTSSIMINSDYAFLKSSYFNPQFLKDDDLNETLFIILGEWYKTISSEDFYKTLIDFVEFLFSDNFVKAQKKSYSELTFSLAFTANNLEQYYYYKCHNNNTRPLGSFVVTNPNIASFLNNIKTEAVLSILDKQIFNSTKIYNIYTAKIKFLDDLRTYFISLFTYLKTNMKTES